MPRILSADPVRAPLPVPAAGVVCLFARLCLARLARLRMAEPVEHAEPEPVDAAAGARVSSLPELLGPVAASEPSRTPPDRRERRPRRTQGGAPAVRLSSR